MKRGKKPKKIRKNYLLNPILVKELENVVQMTAKTETAVIEAALEEYLRKIKSQLQNH